MMKKKKLTKRESDFIHFRRRMYQRYGIAVILEQYQSMVKSIQGRGGVYETKFIRDTYGSRKVYQIKVNGQWIEVIYSTASHSIVTALPDRI